MSPLEHKLKAMGVSDVFHDILQSDYFTPLSRLQKDNIQVYEAFHHLQNTPGPLLTSSTPIAYFRFVTT